MEKNPSYFIPSIGQFLFLVVFLVLSFSPAGKNMLADADTGYHIRAGDYILENRTVPKHDIFSYHSPPLPWTAHEWLSEVVMAVLHRISGLTGVVVFFSFLISLTYAFLFRYMRVYKRNIVFDVLIILLALVSSQIHWLYDQFEGAFVSDKKKSLFLAQLEARWSPPRSSSSTSA